MKKITTLNKLVSLAFVGGFISCLSSLPLAFFDSGLSQIMFFSGGSVGFVSLIYTMITGVYNEQ